MEGLGTWVREQLQYRDEAALLAPVRRDFTSYEEPSIPEVIGAAHPYLPVDVALGEMVLNVGRAIRLASLGVDGIIDISPFTCMNGIVCEAVYPRVSRDQGGLPIRTLYFDGTVRDLESDIELYLDLTMSYRRRKTTPRPASVATRRPCRG
ncbi:MAG: hypothetical protein EHM63_05265 [Actinobacteria bacterium]|nr:MAG: hypothetical protein EHM63_05265 [Actinomycetota bacterium]